MGMETLAGSIIVMMWYVWSKGWVQRVMGPNLGGTLIGSVSFKYFHCVCLFQTNTSKKGSFPELNLWPLEPQSPANLFKAIPLMLPRQPCLGNLRLMTWSY